LERHLYAHSCFQPKGYWVKAREWGLPSHFVTPWSLSQQEPDLYCSSTHPTWSIKVKDIHFCRFFQDVGNLWISVLPCKMFPYVSLHKRATCQKPKKCGDPKNLMQFWCDITPTWSYWQHSLNSPMMVLLMKIKGVHSFTIIRFHSQRKINDWEPF
jgi:hypothetical protein